MPPLILEPLVLARINVQHHPRQWAARPPLAMSAAAWSALNYASALQHALRPGVADCKAMFPRQLLMEVRDVEVEVALAVEAQDLFKHSTGHPARAGLAAPPVEQSMEAEALILLLPAPHVSAADAYN